MLGSLAVVASIVAATGWLYLLRDVGALALGPHIAGALPLQQLAGSDDQPLARQACAWLPAGALAGAALAGTTRLGLAGRAVAIALGCWSLLIVSGAVADAAAISDTVFSHLPAQLGRGGTWTAVALMVIGSLPLTGRHAERRAGATRRRAASGR